MTPTQFRELALALPGAVEGAHQGHADFRVGGKIFATLGPDETWGMVKLPSEMQKELVQDPSASFTPSPGAWGKNGATKVYLASAPLPLVQEALLAALQFVAS